MRNQWTSNLHHQWKLVSLPDDSRQRTCNYILKLLTINCQSIQSLNKRIELSALLLYHDIDIVLENESHIDQTFLSSEILPTSYKIIRKDCSLGGGGMFIGCKNSITILELSNLLSEAEMLWAKLQIPNNQPLYLCSFYRPPNNNIIPVTMLNAALSNIFNEESSHSPQVLLADFNLPSISWIDDIGQICSNPTYCTEVNQLTLESINEFGLDKIVTEPTRGENILDLIFSSSSESVGNTEIIPSDHDAVCCELTLNEKPESDSIRHPVFLYDKGDMNQLKIDISDFQAEFLSSDPYSYNVQENWNRL